MEKGCHLSLFLEGGKYSTVLERNGDTVFARDRATSVLKRVGKERTRYHRLPISMDLLLVDCMTVNHIPKSKVTEEAVRLLSCLEVTLDDLFSIGDIYDLLWLAVYSLKGMVVVADNKQEKLGDILRKCSNSFRGHNYLSSKNVLGDSTSLRVGSSTMCISKDYLLLNERNKITLSGCTQEIVSLLRKLESTGSEGLFTGNEYTEYINLIFGDIRLASIRDMIYSAMILGYESYFKKSGVSYERMFGSRELEQAHSHCVVLFDSMLSKPVYLNYENSLNSMEGFGGVCYAK